MSEAPETQPPDRVRVVIATRERLDDGWRLAGELWLEEGDKRLEVTPRMAVRYRGKAWRVRRARWDRMRAAMVIADKVLDPGLPQLTLELERPLEDTLRELGFERPASMAEAVDQVHEAQGAGQPPVDPARAALEVRQREMLEEHIDACIREHDRRLAVRLRERAGLLREDISVPEYAATKTAHLLADILEADE